MDLSAELEWLALNRLLPACLPACPYGQVEINKEKQSKALIRIYVCSTSHFWSRRILSEYTSIWLKGEGNPKGRVTHLIVYWNTMCLLADYSRAISPHLCPSRLSSVNQFFDGRSVNSKDTRYVPT